MFSRCFEILSSFISIEVVLGLLGIEKQIKTVQQNSVMHSAISCVQSISLPISSPVHLRCGAVSF